jgi:5-(carboxyamino)imidazole ribonucleotide mutase
MTDSSKPRVAVLSGSVSDAEFVKLCSGVLDEFGVAHECRVLSAHRKGEELDAYVTDVQERGCRVFICMAGMAAHLPGVVASLTRYPVLGVPLKGGILDGLDALLSIVQMPKGVPVATLAVGSAGARNAAILATQILALGDDALDAKLLEHKRAMAQA